MVPGPRKRRRNPHKHPNWPRPVPNSFTQIAKRSGIAVGYISRILNGKRDIKLSTARVVAAAMHISLDRLVDAIEVNVARGVPPEVSRRVRDGMLKKRNVPA